MIHFNPGHKQKEIIEEAKHKKLFKLVDVGRYYSDRKEGIDSFETLFRAGFFDKGRNQAGEVIYVSKVFEVTLALQAFGEEMATKGHELKDHIRFFTCPEINDPLVKGWNEVEVEHCSSMACGQGCRLLGSCTVHARAKQESDIRIR